MKIKDTFEFVSKKFELSNKLNRFYLVIIVLLIFFAYLPSLQYNYVTCDQWRAFQYSMLDQSPIIKALGCLHSRIYFDIRSGRPFCSIGECIEHALVRKISDFSTTRPIILILVVLTAFCVGMALSSSVGGITNGMAIGALFVLSPGYAHMYYIGLSAIMILIALILATLSYIFIRQAINESFVKNKLLLSSVLFLIACMIYPAWAFVVFIFSLVDFLFCAGCERNTRLKHLLIKIFFFTIISIIYYLIIKFLILLLPAHNIGIYEYSANFNPLYLSKRFFIAIIFYLLQPPLNTLYSPLNILNIIFLFSVILIFSVSFFKKNKYQLKTVCSFALLIIICFFSIFISITPWLLSGMPFPANRYFITFSLLMCTLIGWIICRASTQLFPTKKYISSILIIFIILLPSSFIQTKRTAIEVGISETEIETMRSAMYNWIDENLFTKKRYIIVVKPKRPRPLFYDRVLNNVILGGKLRVDNPQKFLNDDPLFLFKMFSELINERSDLTFWSRFNLILNIAGYGDSLELSTNSEHYFQMFIALFREKCDIYHPLAHMRFFILSSAQEITLDSNPLNIVFTVIDQGDRIETKHDVLEINFSLITNYPERLLINQ